MIQFIFIFCLLFVYNIVSNALVLRQHDGKLIKGHDLGSAGHQHHVRNILSDTLYPTEKTADLYTRSSVLSSVAVNVDASEDTLILPINYARYILIISSVENLNPPKVDQN